jgi:hypothetical protein
MRTVVDDHSRIADADIRGDIRGDERAAVVDVLRNAAVRRQR